MGSAVAISRLDLTAEGLRSAASVEMEGAAARRILALALMVEGADRARAARTCGTDRQTLQHWVYRYNDEGLGGLRDWAGGGRSRKLSEFAALVEAGPDPALHKVVRWRRADLRDEISGVLASMYMNVWSARSRRPWGYRRLSVRPQHPKSDPAAQEAL